MKAPIDQLPKTQRDVVRMLRNAGEATLHTIAWRTRVYEGAGVDAAYRAVARLEKDGLVETEDLIEASPRRGVRRRTAALTWKGALLFDAQGVTETGFRTAIQQNAAWRGMHRQLAQCTCDYLAADWRSMSGDAVWTALRAELRSTVRGDSVPTEHVDLHRFLLCRDVANIGTWAVVSPSGHVRLVLMASALSEMKALLRNLDTALLASLSALMSLEVLVLGPTEAVERDLVKLVRRWAAPPPKRPIRVAAGAIDPSVRTGSRQAVKVRIETHPRYEYLPHPKGNTWLTVGEAVETRRKTATKWEYPVALVMTPEHPRGVRETELSHSERRWFNNPERKRHRPPPCSGIPRLTNNGCAERHLPSSV